MHSEIQSDSAGHYFIYSLKKAGNSNWIAANFRYSLAEGTTGVSNALFPFRGVSKKISESPGINPASALKLTKVATLQPEGETSGAGVVAFSPDSKRLAVGGFYKEKSYLWEITTRNIIAELAGAGTLIHSVNFSRDGKLLVTTGMDIDASRWINVIWNGQTGQKLKDLPPDSGLRSAVSPDGKTLAVAVLGVSITFFQLPDGQRASMSGLRTKVSEPFDSLVFSPDGKFIAGAQKEAVSIWDTKSLTLKRQFSTSKPVHTIAFSPDSNVLVASLYDGSVGAWNAAKGTVIWTQAVCQMQTGNVAYSPDGKFVAVASSEEGAKILDPATGRILVSVETDMGAEKSVAFSADSRLLAVGDSGGAVVWEIKQD